MMAGRRGADTDADTDYCVPVSCVVQDVCMYASLAREAAELPGYCTCRVVVSYGTRARTYTRFHNLHTLAPI